MDPKQIKQVVGILGGTGGSIALGVLFAYLSENYVPNRVYAQHVEREKEIHDSYKEDLKEIKGYLHDINQYLLKQK